jgi:hypothetical protein
MLCGGGMHGPVRGDGLPGLLDDKVGAADHSHVKDPRYSVCSLLGHHGDLRHDNELAYQYIAREFANMANSSYGR